MKRHLCDAHNIQNVSIMIPQVDAVKHEPMMEMTIDGESVTKELDDDDDDIADKDVDNDDENERNSGDESSEKKVPPLRVRLNGGGHNSTEVSPTASLVQSSIGSANGKSVLSCKLCGNFTTNNSYFLARHKKSCMKKKREGKKSDDQAVEVAVEFDLDEDPENENGIEETE
jgi:hypothetical protein